MKLIFCKECQDVVKLDFAKRECKCGRSSGYYEDSLNAVYWGPCVPLGISNFSLQEAIRWQPDSGQGSVVEAFVIPKKCKTMERLY
jgi:hypothetical protein